MTGKEYDNNMRGVLFRNDKGGVETRADYRGSCEINRVPLWVDAWVNVDRDGKKFMSLRFKPKSAASPPRTPPPIKAPAREDAPFDDDIPF